MMKSSERGKSILKVTSRAEVQDASRFGLWLFVNGKEYFLPYEKYPWFKNAKVSEVYNLELLHGYHLRWPDLDVDLELESLDHPENYPLTYSEKGSKSVENLSQVSEKSGKSWNRLLSAQLLGKIRSHKRRKSKQKAA